MSDGSLLSILAGAASHARLPSHTGPQPARRASHQAWINLASQTSFLVLANSGMASHLAEQAPQSHDMHERVSKHDLYYLLQEGPVNVCSR